MKLRLFTMMLTALAFLGMSSLAFADKVAVCHVTGNGTYHLISININALPAHLAHGDGQPGGAVPNMSGYIFGDNCAPTLAPPPEPAMGCYALPGVDIYYIGPIDTLQNFTFYSSADGSCTSSLGTASGTAIIASDNLTDAKTKCNALTGQTGTFVIDLSTGATPSLPGFWFCSVNIG